MAVKPKASAPARAPMPGIDLHNDEHLAIEEARLAFLKLRPEVNSWLIELSEKRCAALSASL